MPAIPAGASCPSCNALNPNAARFCFQCGGSMQPARCTQCGTTLAVGAKFCSQCGKQAV
ncbi:MAG TPA: zinc ribbon domain-containing protein [Rhodoferax sp.]|nr:zinc ribbon domain-containing protein [Rhodoferax sp.]